MSVKGSGVIALGLMALAISTAIMIGSRLSDQAVAALAGAACGIGLATPLGILLGITVGAARAKSQAIRPAAPTSIVVIPSPTLPTGTSALVPTATSMPAPRSFTIIGDGNEL